jgi:hypothetical protein
MQKGVDKLKDEQTFLSRGSPWRLKLRGSAPEGDRLLAFEGLPVFAQPEQPPLFQIDNLWLRPGDKIALHGQQQQRHSQVIITARTGHAYLPHPALGHDITASYTAGSQPWTGQTYETEVPVEV